MEIRSPIGIIELVDEPLHRIGSPDNVRRYAIEHVFDDSAHASSAHGILIDGEPTALVAASGGASGIHAHSAELVGDSLFVAVGNRVACFDLRPFALRWSLATDDATCFGIHVDMTRGALISHGELEIARFSVDGHILWRAGGADIFSEGLGLAPDAIEATDFSGSRYRFDYASGAALDA